MKIERISDNQIKCTLNRSDLASHQIKISELAYGTEKTRDLFQDMMEQAYMECGFEASDLPLVIEAIPVSTDCIVLMITRVDEPEEVDTDFSSFSNYDELVKNNSENSAASFLSRLFEKGIIQPGDRARALSGRERSLERIFSFDDLEKVLRFANCAGWLYCGESSLYKSPENGRYYLIINSAECSEGEFGQICSTAFEFGSKESTGIAGSAFVREHCEVILESKALQNLASV